MERCPTCGRPVRTVFDHLGEDCETWPEDWTMADLKVPETAAIDIPRTKEEANA
jgi:hypothetical protein